jgi:DNA (cytosine-5)-methyltransferase 1
VFLVGVLADGTRVGSPGAWAGHEWLPALVGGGEVWPTPTVKGDYNRAGLSPASGDGLATAVVGEWATARDTRSCHTGRQGNSRPLSEQVGERGVTGPLNPAWVEALQGFPVGWTDPDADVGGWPGVWPMGRGPEQHPWEPPRMVEARTVKNRSARVKALGNAVVPACAYVVGCRVRERLAMEAA